MEHLACTCIIEYHDYYDHLEIHKSDVINYCPMHNAASDMLEALKSMLADTDNCTHEPCIKARAAIAKAQGK